MNTGPHHTPSFYGKFVKRPFDFLAATLLLILLSPIMLATAVLVRLQRQAHIIPAAAAWAVRHPFHNNEASYDDAGTGRKWRIVAG